MVLAMGWHGDITTSWDAENDTAALAIINEMLQQGYIFSVLQDGALQQIATIQQITDRKVIMPTESFSQAVHNGLMNLGGVRAVGDQETTGEVARDAETVLAHDTIATPPMKGG
jgi:hypothetical protein